ncbi:Structural maintenance of chromosomes protein 5 [Quaeritorhiza haematococci]|nr:Structural maintenance of chromosomes protein 5 [Quaeritorhiza haematococci]
MSNVEESTAAKRSRRSARRNVDEEHEEEEHELNHRASKKHRSGASCTQPPDHDDPEGGNEGSPYPIGSIVRIRLKNFVTYDYVEFFPGPDLNMVIGPNGTGKSTIVCALALGLAGRPELLGRAKELQEFVKRGADKATIELELKSRGRGGNVIIKRIFKRGANSSMWKLNGKDATEREVKEKIRSFSIQVDNLCQFLPQDKVCEFATMTPPVLLKATERAVGGTKLLEHHERLIELRKQEKSAESNVNEEKGRIEDMERRNALLEREVTRIQEREAVEHEIFLIEKRIPWIRYQDERNAWMEARERKNEIQEEYQRLKTEIEPLEAQIDDLKQTLRTCEQEERRVKDRWQSQTRTDLTSRTTALQKCEDKSDTIRKRIDGLKKREQQRLAKINKLKADIDAAQRDIETTKSNLVNLGILDEDGNIVNAAQALQRGSVGTEYNQWLNLHRMDEALKQELNDLRARSFDLQPRQMELAEDSQRTRNRRDDLQEQLRQLDDVRNQKLNLIRREDIDTFEAYQFVESLNRKLENPDQTDNSEPRFRMHVYGPICLEIKIKNGEQHTKLVESQIGHSHMMTFVPQCKEDYRTLATEMIDRRRKRINISMMSHLTLDSPQLQPSISRQEMAAYGFNNYILDFVEGPAPVLVALCSLSQIGRIPVSLGEVDNYRVESDRRINKYVAGTTTYTVARGHGQTSTRAQRLRNPKFLVISVDVERKAAIEQQLHQVQQELLQLGEQLKTINQEDQRIRSQYEGKKAEKAKLQDEKKAIVQQKQAYDRQKAERDTKVIQLSTLESDGTSLEEQEAALKREFREVVVERAKLALQYKAHMKAGVGLKEEYMRAILKSIQTDIEIKETEAQCQGGAMRLRDLEQLLAAATRRTEELKASARRTLAAAKESGADLSEDDKEEMREKYENKTIEELEELLAQYRARADLYNNTNPLVIQEYNERKADIERLKRKLEGKDRELQKAREEVQRIREQWEPALRDLVERISASFSAAFDRIGCAGEVKLAQHEDFENWGIDILVKFRDHEKLQQLTGQRQSGGERSVSTILYLMALQDLSKAPFRVVDEINQGMDPRNERMVHSQIVESACRANTSQYFLITPKLLPNLRYDRKMKVLCIYNGEHQPTELSFGACVQKRRALAPRAMN